jgi:putative ABC transport system substrate-binding protein
MAAATGLAFRTTHAQQSRKPRRIGAVFPGLAPTPGAVSGRELLADALRRRGYEDGKNLQIEYRYAEGRSERNQALLQELIGLGVEILFTAGNSATAAAKRLTQTIPIVMGSGFPVEAGLIESYARPGGNVTGTDWFPPELVDKQYQILKDAVPGATRAARIWYPSNFHLFGEEHLRRVHAVTGLTVVSASMTRAEHLPGALERVAASGAEVLYVQPFENVAPLLPAIVAFAAERGLVSSSEHASYAQSGGLLQYCAESAHMIDRMASQIDRILRGARPGDIPVERPTTFELVLNAKTAKAMGITLPRALMAQVTRVIE